MHRSHFTRMLAVVATGFAVSILAADDSKPAKPAAKADPIPAAARATLEEAGLKVATGGLSLPQEVELGKTLRESARLKKTMMAADRDVYAAQREVDAFRAQINELKLQLTNLNAELTNVTTVAANNRIVGAIRATEGQIAPT